MNINKKPEFLKPFTRFCCTIGHIPASYMVSLSYEEQLLWLCNFLEKKVIPAIDNNAEALKEVQKLYLELKEYVDNYFDNLDIQTEINNKLDEMAIDGTLERIINEELFSDLSNKITNAIISYDTLNDMINDDNLSVGRTVLIKSKDIQNDGFTPLYIIKDDGLVDNYYVIQLNNGLYAHMINNIAQNFYDEITYKKIRYLDTDCYIVTIPKYDKDNNQIKPYVGQYNESGTSLSPTEYARYNNTNLTINASLSYTPDGGQTYYEGSVISNGKILRDYNIPDLPDEYQYLGIKEDNTIVSYQANQTTAQDMIDDGVIQAFLIFGQCVSNGEYSYQGTHYQNKGNGQYIGQKANGDIVILTNDGRNKTNKGLTGEEGSQLLINEGCVTGFILDGGRFYIDNI